MPSLNFDYKKDYVVRCLNANKHNHITTSYYLLLKRYQEKGEVDQAESKYYDDKAIMKMIQEQKREEKEREEREGRQDEEENVNEKGGADKLSQQNIGLNSNRGPSTSAVGRELQASRDTASGQVTGWENMQS